MSSDLSFQRSLLDSSESDEPFDAEFAGMERIELDDGAWVDRQPAWATRPDKLFVTVLETLVWREGVERIRGTEVERPRLVASFASNPLESKAGVPPTLAALQEMATALGRRYHITLDRITCNLYRHGRDSVAWHGDRMARDLPRSTVAILSLGEARPFRLRPKGGGKSLGWPAGRGDLIVMGGSCQRTYDHCVPKVANAGPRIAVMFRQHSD